jgi:hypothetical protein
MHVHAEEHNRVGSRPLPKGLNDAAGDLTGKIPSGVGHQTGPGGQGKFGLLRILGQELFDLPPAGLLIVRIPAAGKGWATWFHGIPPFLVCEAGCNLRMDCHPGYP